MVFFWGGLRAKGVIRKTRSSPWMMIGGNMCRCDLNNNMTNVNTKHDTCILGGLFWGERSYEAFRKGKK